MSPPFSINMETEGRWERPGRMHVPLASAWCRQRSSIVGKYVFPSSGQYPTGPTEGAVTYVFHPQWQILEKVELQGCVIWDWTGCFSEHFAAQMPLFPCPSGRWKRRRMGSCFITPQQGQPLFTQIDVFV